MSRMLRSPRLQKGAIVSIDKTAPVPNVVVFQYNPEKMTRTLKPQHASGEEGKSETWRIDEPPAETISLTADFDATNGLENRDPIAASMGIYPQLAAIETLTYPPRAQVIMNLAALLLGTVEVAAVEAPLTLFVWGAKRVVPVRINSITIDELHYDERLNPTVATAKLEMEVMSYKHFSSDDPGRYIYMAHHAVKEVMAIVGSGRSLNLF